MRYHGSALRAQSIETLEAMALTASRREALSQLIPGTEEAFYFATLVAQTEGNLPEAEATLSAWEWAFPGSSKAASLRDRQLWLDYPQKPQALIDRVIGRLQPNLQHAVPLSNPGASLPSRLEETLPAIGGKIEEAIAADPSLARLETESLVHLVARPMPIESLRAMLNRLDRVDPPGLVDAVHRELSAKDSGGWGSFPIHSRMTLAQRQQLARLQPKLLANDLFVRQWLERLRPDAPWEVLSPNDRRRRLAQLEEFSLQLPDSLNSLKAIALYHRLVWDAVDGIYDAASFDRYLRLPRRAPFLRVEPLQRIDPVHLVEPQASYEAQIGLPPIGDDSQWVGQYLLQLLKDRDPTEAMRSMLEERYLERMVAESRILHGVGDWQSQLAKFSPEEQRALRDRVELRFAPQSARRLSPQDPVQLLVDLKNVPTLSVRIFSLDPASLFERGLMPPSTDLDLDGLVPNDQWNIELTMPPQRLHRQSIPLPQCQGRGVWMVELLGGGLRSRMLIQKGRLTFLDQLTDSGHLLKVIDESGKPVPEAIVQMGVQTFLADSNGTVLIPYGQSDQGVDLLLRAASGGNIERLEHRAESYQLDLGVLVDTQQLISGASASLAMRAQLRCNGSPVPIDLLKQARVTIESIDAAGISAVQSIPDPKLVDSLEWTHSLLVPQGLAQLRVTLEGQVAKATGGRVPVSQSWTMGVRHQERTTQIGDFFLRRQPDQWILELRGRNGEFLAKRAVRVALKCEDLVDPVVVELATDDEGKIELGSLRQVASLEVSSEGIAARRMMLSGQAMGWPGRLILHEGEALVLPWESDRDGGANAAAGELPAWSLIELQQEAWLADRKELVATTATTLEIPKCPAGRFLLTDHRRTSRCELWVLPSRMEEGILLSDHWIAQPSLATPPSVRQVQVNPNVVRVQWEGDLSTLRVHVVATPWVPELPVGRGLNLPPFPARSRPRVASICRWVDSLRVDDEVGYVLRRQGAPKHPGNLLPSPSLLAYPWDTATAASTLQMAKQGDAIPGSADAPAPMERAGLERSLGEEKAQATQSESLRAFEFLKQGAVLLTNRKPDAEGWVEIPRDRLAGHSGITLVAVQLGGVATHSITLEPQEIPTVDLRLATTLPLDQSWAMRRRVRRLEPGDMPTALGDSRTTRVRVFSSLEDLFRWLLPLTASPQLASFEPLVRWHQLSEEEKERFCAEHACHELHLFLWRKDRPFFDRVVRPVLAEKLEKQLVDRYLLELPLEKDNHLWNFSRFNALERVLLASRLPEARDGTHRWLAHRLQQRPPSDPLQAERFRSAIASQSIDMVGGKRVLQEQLWEAESLQRGTIAQESKEDFLALGMSPDRKDRFGVDEFGADEAEGGTRSAGRGEGRQNRPGKPAANGEAGDDMVGGGMGGLGAAGVENRPGDAVRDKSGFGRMMSRRGRLSEASLYRSLEMTRQWAESQFYRTPVELQQSGQIPSSSWLLDWLDATPGPFLPDSILSVSGSLSESLALLALVDLPTEGKPAELTVEQGQIQCRVSQPSLAFVEILEPAVDRPDTPQLLVGQELYREEDQGQPDAAPVTQGPLIRGVVYRSVVVVTNPHSRPQTAELLTQIPQGAVALKAAKVVDSKPLQLQPFESRQESLLFYFPVAGAFDHLGPQIAIDGAKAGAGVARRYEVIDQPPREGRTSWNDIAAWGNTEEVLTYLRDRSAEGIDLGRIAFRMKEKAFFDICLKELESQGVYANPLWAYALVHQDPVRLAQFLEHQPGWMESMGPSTRGALGEWESRNHYLDPWLEYLPLVVARRHQLGGSIVIPNERLEGEYRRLLVRILHHPAIEDRDRMECTVYMLAQNRIADAIAQFEQIDRARLDGTLFYDYLDAYLDFHRKRYDRAAQIASKYLDLGSRRWRERFAEIVRQVRQRDGRVDDGEDHLTSLDAAKMADDPVQRLLLETRQSEMGAIADRQPVANLVQEEGRWILVHRNLNKVQVRYFLIDLEMLFSRRPFLQEEATQRIPIRPNQEEWLELDPAGGRKELKLPEGLANRTLRIEVASDRVLDSKLVPASDLEVAMVPAYARLQVTDRQGKPLEEVYVKVYARHRDGSVRFYKDGYTDLRGQFDYGSLSTPDLETVDRFALLIAHPQGGAVLRQSEPPAR
jgi:hypothetical protein